MDIFKQKRNMLAAIIFLVLLNIVTITLLWLGRPERMSMPDDRNGEDPENTRIHQVLKEELGFDEKQTEKYLTLRNEHRENITRITEEIKRLKKEMFDKALESDISNTLSDSLLGLTLEKQRSLEHLTYNHFVELKKLCSPDQREKLKLLMHKIFAPPRPERRNGGPPLPPGEKPPHLPGN